MAAPLGSGISPAKNAASGQNKISDSIFNGHNYHEWKQRTVAAIAMNGAKFTHIDNALEEGYRAASPFGELMQFPDYDKLQDVARGIITERLCNPYFRLVKDCKSALHMFETLDSRYDIKNEVGAVAARTKLNRLSYDQKSDLRNFLNVFETKAEDAIQAGNDIPERELIYQLATSLDPDYLPVLRGLCNEVEEHQTFALFRERILKHFDMSLLFANILKINSKQSGVKTDSSSVPAKSNKEDHSSNKKSENSTPKKGPRCFNCNTFGHK